jgi:hypothetical protein
MTDLEANGNTLTGQELLRAVETGQIALDEAYSRNVELPSIDKVWPPDLQPAALRHRHRSRHV